MSKMTQYNYDLKNIELSGNRWHLSKLAEECAELSAATLQYLNKENIDFSRVEKEVADVRKALEYFDLIYGSVNVLKYLELKEKRINRKVRKMMKENKRRNEN